MASPDAAILAEIARISGAINRAKAINSASSSNSSSSIHHDVQLQPSTAAQGINRGGRGGYVHSYAPSRGAYPAYRGRGGPSAYGYVNPGQAFRGSHGHYPYHYPGPSSSSTTSASHRHHKPTKGNTTWTPPTTAAKDTSVKSSSSKNKSLVLNNGTTSAKDKSVSPAAGTSKDTTPLPLASTSGQASPQPEQALDKGKGKQETDGLGEDESGPSSDAQRADTQEAKTEENNKKNEDVEMDMEDGEIDESTLPPPEPKKPPISFAKSTNGELTINGVTFIADRTGRKLVRKESESSSTDAAAAAGVDMKGKGKAISSEDSSAASTPSKTSINGQAYVRTKSGNLISTAVLKKRQELAAKKKRISDLVGIARTVQKARLGAAREQKKKTLCRYFQKTGICSRANTCPYIHDSDKVSICPRYLRSNCPLTAATCPLSHVPNAHRMPHCQHYPNCKRGDACPYTHVQVSEDAKICKDFVGMGWCEKGDKCTERHVWECPDFEEKGVCHKRGCKLGHVVRRKGGSKTSSAEAASDKTPIMFIDTKPDPAFVNDSKMDVPRIDRKRSASISVASEEYSSGEEEAANLVKKKIKVVDVPISTDAMQANEDYVTLVFSDMDDDDDDDGTEDDDGSEVESGLEEEDHLDSISRKRGPIVHTYIEEAAHKQDKNEDTAAAPADSSDEEEDTETEKEANSTITHTHTHTHDQANRKSTSATPRARKSSSPNDHGTDESDEDL